MIDRIESLILQLIDQGNLVAAELLTNELTNWRLKNGHTND